MIKTARLSDAVAIWRLSGVYAKKNEMLARTLGDIYESIKEFKVYKQNHKVIGCAALHIYWHNLAEIRTLAVSPRYKRRGMGTALVESCLQEARELGIKKVFTLTTSPEFFKKLGFREMNKGKLPMKVWGDCQRCPKFMECDEVALIKSVD